MNDEIKKIISTHLGDNILYADELTIGHSLEKKYVVRTEKRRILARILPFTSEIATKYNLLMNVGEKMQAVSAPILMFTYGDELIVLFDWIDGITLEDYYKKTTPIEQIETAIRAGKIIREFHNLTQTSQKSSIQINAHSLDSFLNTYLRDDRKEKFQKLISNIKDIDFEYSLIHYDLRPANLMIDDTGRIHIIDFEYMTYYPSFADLTCNLLFSEKYRAFGYGVLYGYFGCKPNEYFWEMQKYLLALELLRFSENKRNQEKDVNNKLRLVEDFLFTNQLFPDQYNILNDECEKYLGA